MIAATDYDLSTLEDAFETVACESPSHRQQGRPPHPADWYAHAECDDVIAVCDRRKQTSLEQGGWQCVPGCGKFHRHQEIGWFPIEHKR